MDQGKITLKQALGDAEKAATLFGELWNKGDCALLTDEELSDFALRVIAVTDQLDAITEACTLATDGVQTK